MDGSLANFFFAETNKLSLSLTVVYGLYILELCRRWWPSVAEVVWTDRYNWSAEDHLASGIFWGFVWNLADNLYWFMAWLAVLMDRPEKEFLLWFGCFANIFFRQCGGIYAVNEHIEAAERLHRGAPRKHRAKWITGGVFFLFIQAVYWLG